MKLEGLTTAVTGGASGLGLATARRLVNAGGYVTIVDLPGSAGAEVAKDLGDRAQFAPADVTDETAFAAALDTADTQAGGLRGRWPAAAGPGEGRQPGLARGLRGHHPAQPDRQLQRAAAGRSPDRAA
jgi:NAD(P)-dependent dehydrogenase (short-subunit alcohol dehydrogenase family)